MILYKYVDLNTAETIMERSTLKFSKASSLNDPFELTSLYYELKEPNQKDGIKHIAASQSYGILSLTRNPLNPLMWAHYGRGTKFLSKKGIELDRDNNSHAGMVFGIDIDLAELNETGLNVIPAKYGSVIYTATKPNNSFDNSENHHVYEGMLYTFQPELLEALQRVFLYKSSHWSYEEEVRVVRNVNRNQKNEIQSVNRACFKEVYIGYRNSFNKNYLSEMKEKLEKSFPDCLIYVCGFKNSEWSFNRIPIDEAIK